MALAPQVTVVTIVLNGARHLLDCLQSVAGQQGVAVEHVVIDGGSTDGSVDLLKLWSDKLAFWSSGPDGGIADAMNKGVRSARGEWILFLHADDYFPEPSALARAVERLSGPIDAAAFPVLFGSPPDLRLVIPRPVGPMFNFKLGMCHQGILTRRDLFLRVGEHDTTLKIAMDYDFYLRAYRKGAHFAAFSAPALAVMRDTGISSRTDWPSLRKRFREERFIHFRHAGDMAQKLAYHLYWLLYLPYRRLRAAFRS